MSILGLAGEREAAGMNVLHLEVGQPSSPTPRPALEAARRELEHGLIGYTPSLGIPALRARISRHYRETYGVDVPAERVIVTTGSSAGFVLAFLALFDAGDRVAVSEPGYPAYRAILEALDIEPVPVRLTEADAYVLTPGNVTRAAAGRPLNGILAMSPANPTGTMMGRAPLAALCAYARDNGIPFISDEIYHGLTYAAPAVSALECRSDAVIINSFSKYFCMTGWRVGWMVVPAHMVDPVERLAQNLYLSPPQVSQKAALAAFDARDDMERIREGYARNRAMLLEELPKIGVTRMYPADGAFYIFADIGDFTGDSIAFCKALLNEAGVAAAPGVDFDPVHGNRFIRLSFARSLDECREAVRRIGQWLGKR
jgi:aspartate/methionine/tyrosine aminotransferase